jgi:hypothetical protein
MVIIIHSMEYAVGSKRLVMVPCAMALNYGNPLSIKIPFTGVILQTIASSGDSTAGTGFNKS